MRLRKRLLSWLLCLSLIVGLFALPAAAMGEERIDIPDARLLALINRTLGEGRADDDPDTIADMQGLTEISSKKLEYLPTDQWAPPVDVNDRGIRSLKGLEYAVNLTTLDLSDNRISDLTPLSQMEHLTTLELDRNVVYDLRPLVGLTGLTHLNVYNNEIEDISPLSSLTGLTYLDMHFANRGKAPVCINPLGDLKNLEYISIESNDISDISALAGLEHLTYIKLNANHITDLTPIQPYIDAIGDGALGCIIEANSQTLPTWDNAVVQCGTQGGEVPLSLPKVRGLDYLLETGMLDGSLGLRSTDEVSVDFFYDLDTDAADISKAVFSFEDRAFGGRLDHLDMLMVEYGVYSWEEGREIFTYTLGLPVRMQQDSTYTTTLSAQVRKGPFIILDPSRDGGKTCTLTGTLSLQDGTPIPLSSIEGITLHNGNSGSIITALSATDISVTGNAYTFSIEAVGETEGAWYVTPEVRYLSEGADAEQTIPRYTQSFHLFVGDSTGLQVDDKILFDLNTLGSDGNIISAPVTIALPGETISWIDIEDIDRSTLSSGVKNPDGTFTFTLAAEMMGQVDHFYYYPSTTALFTEVSVQPASSDPALAGRFTVSGLTRGDSAAPVVRFDGEVFAQSGDLKLTSSDTSILGVRDGRLVGVRAGTADLTLEHLRFPMEGYGSVEYLNPVTVPVTVSPRSSSGGSSTAKPEPKPEVKPEPAAPDTGAVTERYSDLPEGYWANDGIAVVVERGLFVGTGDGSSFSPEQTMDRGMLVTVLGRLAGVSGSAAGAFSDVAPGAYYAPFAAWAKEQGIVSGVGGDRFGPEQPITREQLCVMLVRFAQAQGLVLEAAGEAQAFTDSGDVAEWARDAVELAHSAGLVNGKDGGRFDPQGTATRAEAAVILARFLALFPQV